MYISVQSVWKESRSQLPHFSQHGCLYVTSYVAQTETLIFHSKSLCAEVQTIFWKTASSKQHQRSMGQAQDLTLRAPFPWMAWKVPLQINWSTHPCLNQSQPQQVVQDCGLGFEYLQRWTLHSPSWKCFPVKISLLMFIWNLLYFSQCLWSCHRTPLRRMSHCFLYPYQVLLKSTHC